MVLNLTPFEGNVLGMNITSTELNSEYAGKLVFSLTPDAGKKAGILCNTPSESIAYRGG